LNIEHGNHRRDSTGRATIPTKETRELRNEIKKESTGFNDWPGKFGPVIPHVNLAEKKIPILQSSYAVDSRNEYKTIYPVYDDEVETRYVVEFTYRWSLQSDWDLSIRMFVAGSCVDAQEHLITMISGTADPSPPRRDIPPIAGNVSFKGGLYFVRNNIIMAFSYDGAAVKDILPEIARQIDDVLLAQPTYESPSEVLPVITNIKFEKTGNRKAKISPCVIDPLGENMTLQYRLSGGGIYRMEGKTFYFDAEKPGEYRFTVIAISDSGFNTVRMIGITATENDIFNFRRGR